MNREEWQQIKDLLGYALELELSAREPFIRNAAKDNPEILSELLRLLKESEHETDLLSKPVLADAKALSREEAPRFAPAAFLARRFRIVRFIARGGMGEVYEAEDVELGEHVALKAIRPSVAADTGLRSLFKREIQLARRVTHPNVCRIFDLEQHEDPESGESVLLLSMELIEGQTLAEHLRLHGPLTVRGALPLIEQIATALQAVHDAGIIHGDLKPGNVMLVASPGETAPQARVMDFGMAFPVAQEPGRDNDGFGKRRNAIPESESAARNSASVSSPTLTLRSSSPAMRGGTPDYFAPEQIQGAAATTATDVYALALVIGDMLGVPRSNRWRPDSERMPRRWARILRRCLADDPAHRLKRPQDLASALRAAVEVKSKAKRTASIAACAALAMFLAARRIDVMRGTANRMLLTENSSLDVWRASPDGKFLAATSWDTGDLVVDEVSTGKVRRLTHRGISWQNQLGGTYGAVFSPDSRRIAYQWANSRFDDEIRIIGVDGKGEHTLFHEPNRYASLLDWAPEGARILVRVTDIEGAGSLGILSTQDGSFRLLPSQPAVSDRGAILFGSDGNSIVFDAKNQENDGFEIHRLLLSGEESVLVAQTGVSKVMGWSSDRRRLIFSSDRRGQPGIWAISISASGVEGEARELVPNARDWEQLGLSRSGMLFYEYDNSSMDVYTAVLDLNALRTLSAPQRVTERFIGSYSFPNWSEDGSQLVFGSRRDRSSPGFAIYDLRTGRIRELQPNLQFSWRPQWVAHGAAIMAPGTAADGRQGLFRIDPRSGEATLFQSAKELGTTFEGVWSRDGKFHYNRYGDFRRGIFRLNIETGETRVLYLPPAGVEIGMENLALSPDGRLLAFHARSEAAGTSTLMVIPSEGGEARPLLVLKRPEAFAFGSFAWTPDSRQILAARTRSLNRSPADEKVSEIWLVPVDGSVPRKVDFPPMFVTCLRLSPDGQSIAFQVHQDRREVWILQNFL